MDKLQRFGLLGLTVVLLASFWAGLWYQGHKEAATLILEGKTKGEEIRQATGAAEQTEKETTIPEAGEQEPVADKEKNPAAEAGERFLPPEQPGLASDPGESRSKDEIAVHVIGRVKVPGLYYLPAGSRIYDAVNLAEPEENADLARLNLALTAEDGMQIRVPSIGVKGEWEGGGLLLRPGEENLDTGSGKEGAGPAGETAEQVERGLLNLNRATAAELISLPGIGQVYAERIIRYREKNGGFKNIDELKNIKGIGDAKFLELRDLVCCG
ncbi:MAG: ComEA family DNA-binding protein [Peptococcaceae bacterium]|nr:ComEA family DNA-binding protein [Peptococcaceae bacterium]